MVAEAAGRTWRFSIPDVPVAAARPRVATRGGRPHGYVPAKTARATWAIREHVAAQLGSDWQPLVGPLRVTVTVWLRQPTSVPKRNRLTARPTRRPDVDNYAKTALDGLSPLWIDDAQVVELVAAKRYAVASAPRWELTVSAVVEP
jgi:Holliday junction resolvase RusA-like endonuclease